jgi:predicted transcriptional regulator
LPPRRIANGRIVATNGRATTIELGLAVAEALQKSAPVRQAKRVRVAAPAVAAMLVLVVSSGCGGDAEATAQCKAESENNARAAVIAEAYEQGRIGTTAEVVADWSA